ncbi:MAG: cobalt-precorrin-5B (C(1))-methyltransferase [Methanomicrobiales archaeon]|nr:cobalt-precorrin-5B (C(1))-methyltransferase [Methanomicrobiales archaeon]
MRDPVTDFTYPEEWVRVCRSEDDRQLAASGLGVLTSSGKVLRRGFTTGTTAAAAAKAAILSLRSPVSSVEIRIHCGLIVTLPVRAQDGSATCRKDAGDHPRDVTGGVEIQARAVRSAGGIRIEAGEGIGRFARDIQGHRRGEPAISDPAMACILNEAKKAALMAGIPGAVVTLSVPEGKTLAGRTLNPRVGVQGGISILGTTGLVEPWDDHLAESVRERVAAADRPVITSGRIGLRFARMLYPDREVILAGGRIAEALAAARGEVTLFGLPGLILRFLDPSILEGTGCTTVADLAQRPEFPRLAHEAVDRFQASHPRVTIVIIDRQGRVLEGGP